MSAPKVIPRLVLAGCARAIDFYAHAFGAVEKARFADPQLGGKIVHAEITIGGCSIYLTDEDPEWKSLGPKALGGTPVVLTLEVDDPDAVCARALEVGATVVYPIENQFYGDRSGRIEDPWGHQWVLSKKIEELSAEEIQARMAKWWAEKK